MQYILKVIFHLNFVLISSYFISGLSELSETHMHKFDDRFLWCILKSFFQCIFERCLFAIWTQKHLLKQDSSESLFKQSPILFNSIIKRTVIRNIPYWFYIQLFHLLFAHLSFVITTNTNKIEIFTIMVTYVALSWKRYIFSLPHAPARSSRNSQYVISVKA